MEVPELELGPGAAMLYRKGAEAVRLLGISKVYCLHGALEDQTPEVPRTPAVAELTADGTVWGLMGRAGLRHWPQKLLVTPLQPPSRPSMFLSSLGLRGDCAVVVRIEW